MSVTVTVTGPALQINLKIRVFWPIRPGPVHVGSSCARSWHGSLGLNTFTRRRNVYATWCNFMQVTGAERQAAASGQAPLVNPVLFGFSIIWPLEIVLNNKYRSPPIPLRNQNGINGVVFNHWDTKSGVHFLAIARKGWEWIYHRVLRSSVYSIDG